MASRKHLLILGGFAVITMMSGWLGYVPDEGEKQGEVFNHSGERNSGERDFYSTELDAPLEVQVGHSERAVRVARMQEEEDRVLAETREKAGALGLPLTGVRADGTEFLLSHFEGERPRYIESHNAEAAISTATDLVRQKSPYHVDGAGVVIGQWESGAAPRLTHEEFGSPTRMSLGDSGATGMNGNHSTHVAGVLIAEGVEARRKGMAPAARVRFFDNFNAGSELMSEGATAPGQSERLYLSNHSYGRNHGWTQRTISGVRTWVWDEDFSNNSLQDDSSPDFGRYNADAVLFDQVSHAAPYHLLFTSAGNQRNDGPPSEGEEWRAGGTSGPVFSYDSSTHPLGDGEYKNGFDTLGGYEAAKNVIVVGAVETAETAGGRDLSKALLAEFSSTGPTDDGRIKPDLVANGVDIISSIGTADDASGRTSGTSQSCPNACGSAALLVELYRDRFPGQDMRAATLKALILHTADDLGNAGPDYQYGWGLMNTKAAADLLEQHAGSAQDQLIESQLNTGAASREHIVLSDGSGPLKVTLCWTDPSGEEISGSDSRARRLVNDLNLRLIAPDGSVARPWVMPYVGDWTLATIDAPATTGVNTVDNVEQVLLAAPAAGSYRILVDHAGELEDAAQDFSLVISGNRSDDLQITSTRAFESSARAGRAASLEENDYLLENLSASDSLDWTLTESSPWLELSARSGSLAPGASTTVTARLNSNGRALAPGDHSADLIFENLSSGLEIRFRVELTILPVAQLPVVEDFEDSIPGHWESTGTNDFRTVRTTSLSPRSGDFHLLMDDSETGGDFSHNELTLHVDLARASDVRLTFWARETGDEPHPAPAVVPFGGRADFDGVSLTVDGTQWYPVFEFPENFEDDTRFELDLDAALASRGLTYSDQTQLRFHHYDDSAAGSDGILLDDISLTGTSLTAVEAWRQTHFGTTENTGPAADLEDPNGDGLVNFAAFALGRAPLDSSGAPLKLSLQGGSVTLSYARSLEALRSGVRYTLEYNDVLSGTWTSLPNQEAVLSTTEGQQLIEMQGPAINVPHRFFRLRLEK